VLHVQQKHREHLVIQRANLQQQEIVKLLGLAHFKSMIGESAVIREPRQEWTAQGRLRHAKYPGLTTDKDAEHLPGSLAAQTLSARPTALRGKLSQHTQPRNR
jgi:hypothetical protein